MNKCYGIFVEFYNDENILIGQDFYVKWILKRCQMFLDAESTVTVFDP